ncbi:hypothetical protein A1O3_02700 [Capronia epimyces CBS 606.96]|uniref:EthD domain-containing protein n=1 Tax=Capronia epimyces CBS 606.96 TaxID=1182542 RepID=W9YAS7_9EURO|nr:uncharacterized protein A1O3_02700 [Capronia epimyces CBS 606.96]EXJ89633.1 hypothetical protein A1O3_02700 [Capronia epimyces CBS 606.96]
MTMAEAIVNPAKLDLSAVDPVPVPVDHQASQPKPQSQRKRYLSITILGYRNPSLSEAEYVEHMTKITAPLNKYLMVKCGVKRWTQIHCTEETRALTKELFDRQMANVVDYDCFSQVVFHSLEDYKKIKQDPWYRQMLVPDHEKFADTKRTKIAVGWIEEFVRDGEVCDRLEFPEDRAQNASSTSASASSSSPSSLLTWGAISGAVVAGATAAAAAAYFRSQ